MVDNPIPIDVIVCSPLRRTLQTMEISFKSYIHKELPVPIKISPLFEESGNWPCDCAMDLSSTEKLFPDYDFSSCYDDIYPLRRGLYGTTYDENYCRAQKPLKHLASLHEKNIVVVTHSVYLRFLLREQRPEDNMNFMPPEKVFRNCEIRKYNLCHTGFQWELIPLIDN